MQTDKDDMQEEYDFSNQQGERGKYYKAYRQGHQVRIHKEDGTTEVHYFTLEEGAVMLESDVQKYFSNSEAVNRALRGLIELVPNRTHSIKG